MKVTLEMSDELVNVDGVICRIWNGYAENEVPVRFYVHRVAVPIKLPQKLFQEELIKVDPPETEEDLRTDPGWGGVDATKGKA
jgi:hypothetical protein